MLVPILACILTRSLAATAGTVPIGDTCSNDHFDPLSHKFVSQCTEEGFCSAPSNGTCLPRQCRRDEFPFGFPAGDPLPPQCSPGSFCPDEGNGCMLLNAVGTLCQFNRDEQCAPPLDWEELASPRNFNGSTCLNFVCEYANVTLGSPCMIENTTYNDVDLDGRHFNNTIIRDNCQTHFYCDSATMVCGRTKSLGQACLSDSECETNTCGATELCSEPPETPLRVAPWHYMVTGICIIGAMISVCMLLTLIHKKHRYKHYKEVKEYYLEQISLRRTIIALHAAAADRYTDEIQKKH